MFVKFDFSDLELMVPTLLKTKEQCHLWFHEEPLLSMEPFNCKKGSLDFLNVLHSKKKNGSFENQQWFINGISAKILFRTFIFKSAPRLLWMFAKKDLCKVY